MGIGNYIAGEDELRLLPTLCDPGRLALDVGANFGAYSYLMRNLSRRCIAFEPNPTCARWLRKVFPEVQVEEVALSGGSGETQLVVPRKGDIQIEAGGKLIEHADRDFIGLSSNLNVTTRSLDSYRLNDVGIIKIDTEGHELSVLEGAAATIDHSLPRFIIECEERHRKDALASVMEFFRPFRYKTLSSTSRGNYAIVHHAAEVHSQGYGQNYLFIHDDDPISDRLYFSKPTFAAFHAFVPRPHN